MTDLPSPRRKRGRPKKGEIQVRRFDALRELLRDDEDWLPVLEKSQLGQFSDAAEIEYELDELFAVMMTSVSDLGADPPTRPLRDEVQENPEAHLLHALTTTRWLHKVEAKLHRLRSRLDTIQSAITEAQKDSRLWAFEALAQRPTIDREVFRRAQQLEAAGVDRQSVGQIKRNAELAWKNPVDWSDLPRRIGGVEFIEKWPNPAQSEILAEALPPLRLLRSYGFEPDRVGKLMTTQSGDQVFEVIVDGITSWMNRYCPRYSSRELKTIARGWTVLLLSNTFDFSTVSRFPTMFLRSPWSPEMIIEISRE